MTFCTRCGKEAPAGAAFCPACGFSLRASHVPPGPARAGATKPVWMTGRLGGVTTPSGPLGAPGWPIVTIASLPVVAEIGEAVDIGRVAKVLGRVEHLPKTVSSVILRLREPPVAIQIHSSGRIGVFEKIVEFSGGQKLFLHLKSEAQARAALEVVVRQLKQAGVPIQGGPTVKLGPATSAVYLGQGIEIRSLPERIPNSLYAQRLGTRDSSGASRVQGRYRRADATVELTSQEQLLTAIEEITGGWSRTPNLPHVAYCKLPESHIVAQMVRSLDRDGNMVMTGFAILYGARSEAEAQGTGRYFGTMLEQAGLLVPLTPRDRIPEDQLRQDPGAFDYFAIGPSG